MQGLRWIQMTDTEIDDFLGRGGTGVLSFATDEDRSPASIPVSYGYNDADGSFYFNLSFPPNSDKAERIEEPVTFVIYDETDVGWQSVVASGRLESVDDHPYESAAIQGMWAIRIPEVDIFERPRDEVTFRHYRLEPDQLSGRKEAPSEE